MKLIRYVIALILFAALIVLAGIFSGGEFLLYVDIPSLLMVPGIAVVLLRATWTFREMGAAFAAAVAENAEPAARTDAVLFFTAFGRYLYVAGGLAVMLGTVAILKNLSDPTKLGPNFAVALISLFYAFFFDLAVALPFRRMAERGAPIGR